MSPDQPKRPTDEHRFKDYQDYHYHDEDPEPSDAPDTARRKTGTPRKPPRKLPKRRHWDQE